MGSGAFSTICLEELDKESIPLRLLCLFLISRCSIFVACFCFVVFVQSDAVVLLLLLFGQTFYLFDCFEMSGFVLFLYVMMEEENRVTIPTLIKTRSLLPINAAKDDAGMSNFLLLLDHERLENLEMTQKNSDAGPPNGGEASTFPTSLPPSPPQSHPRRLARIWTAGDSRLDQIVTHPSTNFLILRPISSSFIPA